MRRSIFTLLFVATCAISVNAQGGNLPKFGQYAVKVEKVTVKSINFKKGRDARTFRTRLSDALRSGVNFAGHYVIASWGCGTGCNSGAIIDARKGIVYWPEQFNALSLAYDDSGYLPLEFRKNSRLLILRGVPGTRHDEDPSPEPGDYYFEWKNNRLIRLRFIQKRLDRAGNE